MRLRTIFVANDFEVLSSMSETTQITGNSAPAVAASRKKSSTVTYARTEKAFVAASKETPDGIHKAAAAWLTVLDKAAKPLDRDESLQALAEYAAAGNDLGTTQQPIRIIYFWKKPLVEQGYLKVLRNGVEVAAEVTAPAAAPAVVSVEV